MLVIQRLYTELTSFDRLIILFLKHPYPQGNAELNRGVCCHIQSYLAPLAGYMEVYEDTFEKISYSISQSEMDKKRVLPTDDDGALDMFGEEFDEKHSKDQGMN